MTVFLSVLALLCFPLLQYAYLLLACRRAERFAHSGKRPAWLPYIVPGLGHSISILTCPLEFVGHIRYPVRLRLPGINPYLVQGAHNIRAIFKQSSKTNPGAAQKFIAARLFGMPNAASETFVNDISGYSAKPLPGTEHIEPRNRICYRDHEILKSLLQGSEISHLTCIFQGALLRRFDHLPITEEWMEIPDLFNFFTTHITPAAIEAFVGPSLTEIIDPDFVRDFWRFDSWVPAMAKRAPKFWIPEAFRLRDKLVDSMERWRNYLDGASDEARSKCPPAMLSKFELRDADGWDTRAVAASDLGLIWASNSNSISALYWLNLEILRSPHLLHQIRHEFAESISLEPLTKSGPAFDLQQLMQQPYMQASFSEVLRQRTHIFLTRYPDRSDLILPQCSIPAKSLVMISSTASHMDETLWNTGANGEHPLDTFWPERFLKHPVEPMTGPMKQDSTPRKLSTPPYAGSRLSDIENGIARQSLECDTRIDHAPYSSSVPPATPTPALSPAPPLPPVKYTRKGLEGIWMPFGGGSQMCPGQNFAKAEIFLSTALLLTCFDIELRDPGAHVRVSGSHFGTGVSKPATPVPFRIRRRKQQIFSSGPSSIA